MHINDVLIGYARVSTEDQNLTPQCAALNGGGAGLRSLAEPWADTTSLAAAWS